MIYVFTRNALILDENGVITLKYQWLSGKQAGEITENKENNVNASIHKYQTRLLLEGKSQESSGEVVTLQEHHRTILEMQSVLHEFMESFEKYKENVKDLRAVIKDKNERIDVLNAEIMRRDDRLELLTDRLIGITPEDKQEFYNKRGQ